MGKRQTDHGCAGRLRRGSRADVPELDADIEYIRRQSFWFDLKIVIRQIWQLLGDVTAVAADDGDD